MSGAPAAPIAAAFLAACDDELEAPKPGNVHVFAGGHGMSVEQFRLSAAAAAKPLCEHGASVGARIFGAVAATAARVGLNTNLGIVLLCAPLAAAAERAADAADFPAALKSILAGLTRADAQCAFEAIVMANPAGLGGSGRHDVREPARTTLLEAMREAADRDRVAAQYANDYIDVFATGLSALHGARDRDWPAPWPAVSVYLSFLAQFPDSHIARKRGAGAAVAVQQSAIGVRDGFMTAVAPAAFLADLLEFDRRLKAGGQNPGTSADLTVATLFADRLTHVLKQPGNNG
jgi:triphosphoribosyl-dephospho-CoA synthase